MHDCADVGTPAGAVLLMTFDVRPGSEPTFNQWYDQTHVPEMLMQRGVRSARRFVAHQMPMRYLTIYELDSADVLESPAFVAWRDASASTRTMVAQHLASSTRAVFEAL